MSLLLCRSVLLVSTLAGKLVLFSISVLGPFKSWT